MLTWSVINGPSASKCEQEKRENKSQTSKETEETKEAAEARLRRTYQSILGLLCKANTLGVTSPVWEQAKQGFTNLLADPALAPVTPPTAAQSCKESLPALSCPFRQLKYLCLKSLAGMERRQKKNLKSLEFYVEALEYDGSDPMVWLYISSLASGCGRNQLAFFASQRASECSPLSSTPLEMMARLLFDANDQLALRNCCRELLQRDPHNLVAKSYLKKLSNPKTIWAESNNLPRKKSKCTAGKRNKKRRIHSKNSNLPKKKQHLDSKTLIPELDKQLEVKKALEEKDMVLDESGKCQTFLLSHQSAATSGKEFSVEFIEVHNVLEYLISNLEVAEKTKHTVGEVISNVIERIENQITQGQVITPADIGIEEQKQGNMMNLATKNEKGPIYLTLQIPTWFKVGELLVQVYDDLSKEKSTLETGPVFGRQIRFKMDVNAEIRDPQLHRKKRARSPSPERDITKETEKNGKSKGQHTSQEEKKRCPAKLNLKRVPSDGKTSEAAVRRSSRRIEQKKDQSKPESSFSPTELFQMQVRGFFFPSEGKSIANAADAIATGSDSSCSFSAKVDVIPSLEKFIEQGSSPEVAMDSGTRLAKEMLPLWKGGNNLVCEVCCKGGRLLLCDFCNIVHHFDCLPRPLPGGARIENVMFACNGCVAEAASLKRAQVLSQISHDIPPWEKEIEVLNLNSGVLDAMYKYLQRISTLERLCLAPWESASDLQDLMVRIGKLTRTFVSRSIYWNAVSFPELRTELFLAEIHLQKLLSSAMIHSKKTSEDTEDHLEILDEKIFRLSQQSKILSPKEEIRFWWLQALYERKFGSKRQAIAFLKECKGCITNHFKQDECITLPHCTIGTVISLSVISKKLKELESVSVIEKVKKDFEILQSNAADSTSDKEKEIFDNLCARYFSANRTQLQHPDEIIIDVLESEEPPITQLIEIISDQFPLAQTGEIVYHGTSALNIMLSLAQKNEGVEVAMSFIFGLLDYLRTEDICGQHAIFQARHSVKVNPVSQGSLLVKYIILLLVQLVLKYPIPAGMEDRVLDHFSWTLRFACMSSSLVLLDAVKRVCNALRKVKKLGPLISKLLVTILQTDRRPGSLKAKVRTDWLTTAMDFFADQVIRSDPVTLTFTDNALDQVVSAFLGVEMVSGSKPQLQAACCRCLVALGLLCTTRDRVLRLGQVCHTKLGSDEACGSAETFLKEFCSNLFRFDDTAKCSEDSQNQSETLGSLPDHFVTEGFDYVLATAQCIKCLYGVQVLKCEDHKSNIMLKPTLPEECMNLFKHVFPLLQNNLITAKKIEVFTFLEVIASHSAFAYLPSTRIHKSVESYLFGKYGSNSAMMYPELFHSSLEPEVPENAPYIELHQALYFYLAEYEEAAKRKSKKSWADLAQLKEIEAMNLRIAKNYIQDLGFHPNRIESWRGLVCTLHALVDLYQNNSDPLFALIPPSKQPSVMEFDISPYFQHAFFSDPLEKLYDALSHSNENSKGGEQDQLVPENFSSDSKSLKQIDSPKTVIRLTLNSKGRTTKEGCALQSTESQIRAVLHSMVEQVVEQDPRSEIGQILKEMTDHIEQRVSFAEIGCKKKEALPTPPTQMSELCEGGHGTSVADVTKTRELSPPTNLFDEDMDEPPLILKIIAPPKKTPVPSGNSPMRYDEIPSSPGSASKSSSLESLKGRTETVTQVAKTHKTVTDTGSSKPQKQMETMALGKVKTPCTLNDKNSKYWHAYWLYKVLAAFRLMSDRAFLILEDKLTTSQLQSDQEEIRSIFARTYAITLEDHVVLLYNQIQQTPDDECEQKLILCERVSNLLKQILDLNYITAFGSMLITTFGSMFHLMTGKLKWKKAKLNQTLVEDLEDILCHFSEAESTANKINEEHRTHCIYRIHATRLKVLFDLISDNKQFLVRDELDEAEILCLLAEHSFNPKNFSGILPNDGQMQSSDILLLKQKVYADCIEGMDACLSTDACYHRAIFWKAKSLFLHGLISMPSNFDSARNEVSLKKALDLLNQIFMAKKNQLITVWGKEYPKGIFELVNNKLIKFEHVQKKYTNLYLGVILALQNYSQLERVFYYLKESRESSVFIHFVRQQVLWLILEFIRKCSAKHDDQSEESISNQGMHYYKCMCSSLVFNQFLQHFTFDLASKLNLLESSCDLGTLGGKLTSVYLKCVESDKEKLKCLDRAYSFYIETLLNQPVHIQSLKPYSTKVLVQVFNSACSLLPLPSNFNITEDITFGKVVEICTSFWPDKATKGGKTLK